MQTVFKEKEIATSPLILRQRIFRDIDGITVWLTIFDALHNDLLRSNSYLIQTLLQHITTLILTYKGYIVYIFSFIGFLDSVPYHSACSSANY